MFPHSYSVHLSLYHIGKLIISCFCLLVHRMMKLLSHLSNFGSISV
ncbi:hypothetical protein HanPSC8_Chr17g0762831 [Helianthus annuus]|nr:hypothetical protein HanPSC8_Chr17g0762831 [Helianthus annuus]